jgi:hypothetical protein
MPGEAQPPVEAVKDLPKTNDIAEPLPPGEQLKQNENEGREIQEGLAESQNTIIDNTESLVDSDGAEELKENASKNGINLLLSRFYTGNESYGESQILSTGISQDLGGVGFKLESYMLAKPAYGKEKLNSIDLGEETARFAVEIPDVSLVLGAERALKGGNATAVTAELTVFDNGEFVITPYVNTNIGDKPAGTTVDTGVTLSAGGFYLEGGIADIGGDRALSLLVSNEIGNGINVYASADTSERKVIAGIKGEI